MKSPDHPTLRRTPPHPTLRAAALADRAATVLSWLALAVGVAALASFLTLLGSVPPGNGGVLAAPLVGGAASAFGLWATSGALRLGAAVARELRQQTDMQARANEPHIS